MQSKSLLCLLCFIVGPSFVLSYTKEWLPNTNWDNPKNWDKGRPPGDGDTVIFEKAEYSYAVYVSSSTIVAELRLGENSTLVLEDGRNITLNGNDTGDNITFIRSRTPEDWFDPLNWETEELRDSNQILLPLDRVPCKHDNVVFPENSSFLVNITRDVSVSKLLVGKMNISNSSELLESQTWSPQFKAVDGVEFNITNKGCEEPTGCPCIDAELQTEICEKYVECNKTLSCNKPIRSSGDCCDFCGAIISLKPTDNFSLQNLTSKLQGILGGKPSTTFFVQASANDGIVWAVRKNNNGGIDVVIKDNSGGNASEAKADEVQSLLKTDFNGTFSDLAVNKSGILTGASSSSYASSATPMAASTSSLVQVTPSPSASMASSSSAQNQPATTSGIGATPVSPSTVQATMEASSSVIPQASQATSSLAVQPTSASSLDASLAPTVVTTPQPSASESTPMTSSIDTAAQLSTTLAGPEMSATIETSPQPATTMEATATSSPKPASSVAPGPTDPVVKPTTTSKKEVENSKSNEVLAAILVGVAIASGAAVLLLGYLCRKRYKEPGESEVFFNNGLGKDEVVCITDIHPKTAENSLYSSSDMVISNPAYDYTLGDDLDGKKKKPHPYEEVKLN